MEELIKEYADRLCQQIYTKKEIIELLTELCEQYHENTI